MSDVVFKKGDKIRIYDSAWKSGVGEIELNFDELKPNSFMTVVSPVGIISVHVKQCELIERPKQKVKLYQFAHKGDDGRWRQTVVYYFKDEESLRKEIFPKDSNVELIRLDHTMIEVDDENGV